MDKLEGSEYGRLAPDWSVIFSSSPTKWFYGFFIAVQENNKTSFLPINYNFLVNGETFSYLSGQIDRLNMNDTVCSIWQNRTPYGICRGLFRHRIVGKEIRGSRTRNSRLRNEQTPAGKKITAQSPPATCFQVNDAVGFIRPTICW